MSLTLKMVQDVIDAIALRGYAPPSLVISLEAHKKLQTIYKIEPNFHPYTEAY
jgi:hypothetical protein